MTEAAARVASGPRIGLFGGTFDPPHRAHQALAAAALQGLGLDEIRWIPTGQPWHKARKADEISPAVHRQAMVELAVAGEPRFVLETCELQRAGPTYTIDTVERLCAASPSARWFLLIGLDQYAALHTWHRWQDLVQRVTLAVALRPETAAVPPATAHGAMALSIPLPPMDVSSSDIRQRVARGESIDHLVPPGVARYIDRHHLYRKDAVAH